VKERKNKLDKREEGKGKREREVGGVGPLLIDLHI
jgi:hypothetical protein